MSFPIDFALVQDVILLLVSGLACLYCFLLNRRLKGLSNLKTGVGASIVSLTNAIRDTHKAAQTTQDSTLESIEILKDLLVQASAASVKMEAETITLQRKIQRASQLQIELDNKVEADLPAAIQKAQNTASNLLKVVTDIEKYRLSVSSNNVPEMLHEYKEEEAQSQDSETNTPSPSYLTVVENEIEADSEVLVDMSCPEVDLEIPSLEGTQKDPIDELFDDIDMLVQAKGVRKRLGFLKSREYYKS